MRGSDSKRDLMAIDDVSEELSELIAWAIAFKHAGDINYEFKPLDGMSIGSIYEKPSTRTRVSFEVGVSRLGGHPLTLLSNDIQLGKSESIADTAAVLSRYLDGITYRCFKHGDAEELARHATVPVINALSDLHHPCQAAADLMTIAEHGESVSGHIAWVGDGNNVFHDLLLAGVALGHDVSYATPAGFEPDESVMDRARRISATTGAIISGSNDPVKAVSGAGVVYTDIFVSMGEEHMEGKFNAFDGFQVNEELVSNANPDYLFMHCLPAHRGEEVTDAVIDSPNSVVFEQAENRMWAQMSLLTYLCNETAWHAFRELE
ncbi:MAG: ornithine carbamoyltransferase [Candidatus Thalassarchaeum betae]|uniref:Ornithine carbamoyltransferase n=1 Tax=Candidatus Thalassarchaeum betae TaxID=2599289 RepID=A0A2V3HTR6_9ARCH|nr:MAG: ornithine carbamoyltransferase [Candidatus Thalassoarchaea betae]PXF26682.1 MAG: ornithine carbamoyltransferase [Euryarchaeota archaeon]HIM14080.1 ornithine carbamoyltransferase [Candidatus Poseidoniales archaeon]HIM93243.1 ornithine carbamoyltransferase [Candidatus Poseidoniales archaeon]